MVAPQTISITLVKPALSDAKRMAVVAIEDFLLLYYPYPKALLDKTHVPTTIGGYWLSRVPEEHRAFDFLPLTRDVLLYLQSGGHRSQISDQLAYYFSGFMPSYRAACIFLSLIADDQPWPEVQAFMHSISYGNAREYVETFDWKAGEKKAQAELKAWADVIQAEVNELEALSTQPPERVAYVAPGLPPGVLTPPAMTPAVPPVLEVPLAPASEGVGIRLLTQALRWRLWLVPLLFTAPTANGSEVEWLRKQKEDDKHLQIRDVKETLTVRVNSTNNLCKPQTAQNQKNGAECENDGYVLMETALKYRRLVDPPKGRGLDGLFEKLAPDDGPKPIPDIVTVPKLGKIVFIPEEAEPPHARYDFTGKPPRTIYPKFVVFEAKHVSQSFDESNKDGIKKESKKRLKNTCDGQQMGEDWTEKRIPQALERQNPGAKYKPSRKAKEKEITDGGYARWIFVCLPGPVGSNGKLYVFIDVVASGMDLESKTPKTRKSDKPTPDTGY